MFLKNIYQLTSKQFISNCLLVKFFQHFKLFHVLKLFIIITSLTFFACENNNPYKPKKSFKKIYNNAYIANKFDFPVGKPGAKGYYNAQKFAVRNKQFGNNFHLGEDWNGLGGGNTDLGDAVYSIGNGLVVFSKNCGGGWGNVVRIIHKISEKKYVESVYAHLKDIKVKEGTFVKRGFQIGTIGNVNGLYYAHLHFELRSKINMPLGGGYASSYDGYLNPTKFIRNN